MSLPWKGAKPKVAFISGGSSGIGLECAKQLADEGLSIAIFNRKLAPQVVEQLAQRAVHSQQRFASYAADVTDLTALHSAFAQAASEVGAPQLLINSAGIIISAPFEEIPSSDFAKVIEVNLLGSQHFAAAAWPYLQPGSHLVLVSSLAGLVGNYGYAAYNASKFGVVGLAKALDLELRLRQVQVSLCCPGVVLTPMVEAEHQREHPLTRRLAELPGVLPVDQACRELLRGVARRQFEITAGTRPRLLCCFNRLVPGVLRQVNYFLARRWQP